MSRQNEPYRNRSERRRERERERERESVCVCVCGRKLEPQTSRENCATKACAIQQVGGLSQITYGTSSQQSWCIAGGLNSKPFRESKLKPGTDSNIHVRLSLLNPHRVQGMRFRKVKICHCIFGSPETWKSEPCENQEDVSPKLVHSRRLKA